MTEPQMIEVTEEILAKLRKIIKKPFVDAWGVHYQPDGVTLAGLIKLPDGRWVPFRGSEVFEEIAGKRVENVAYLHSQKDGTLAGTIKLPDGRWLPFRGNEVIEEIEGKKILYAQEIRSKKDGTITGRAKLSDTRWLYFFWDREGRVIPQ